ncbi:MAG TPA: nucleoside-diphosphate-sugar pyrophosphorylase [Cyanobacteria bacterium UBA8803]|nr:nucleoside-diphosphate-sugar pyrophosphorylase [Cyanobacteria bacterium UBA9273]HBL61159.1 nucleoside-diphosphate-sugar pyrophosphorylase [Cyanobacteria bacterium UBA8803]
MQALILAGGRGTRLHPYTTVLPKPLMPVGDYPILEIILRQLKGAGVTDVILAVGYLSQLLQAFFQNGDRLGLNISYSFEEKALGTAGPIGLVLDRLEDNFLVMNGDLMTTLSYRNLFAFHQDQGAAATLGTYKREVRIDFGVIETDENSKLVRYIEKPTYHFEVSMGVNVLNKKAIAPYLKAGEYLDIPDLMLQLCQDGYPVHCYQEPCYWLDIGRMEDYRTATEIFESKQAEFLPDLSCES